MPESPDFSALIGSRICHDLVNPIGAIGNGVELMQMDGAVRGPELTLIAESVANANARIRFFRIAFGASGGQRVSKSEVLAVLSDLTHGYALTGPVPQIWPEARRVWPSWQSSASKPSCPMAGP